MKKNSPKKTWGRQFLLQNTKSIIYFVIAVTKL